MALKLKELIDLVEVKLNYAIMPMTLLVLWQTFILFTFLHDVDEFGKASGAKLNKDKCSGIWLGKYTQNNLLLNYCNTKWELNAKVLGIYVGVEDIDNANWSTRIDRINKQIQDALNRNLTLKGRAIILNTKIFSRLWYKAPVLAIPDNVV